MLGKVANRRRKELFEQLTRDGKITPVPRHKRKERVVEVIEDPGCYCQRNHQPLPNHFVSCLDCPLTSGAE